VNPLPDYASVQERNNRNTGDRPKRGAAIALVWDFNRESSSRGRKLRVPREEGRGEVLSSDKNEEGGERPKRNPVTLRKGQTRRERTERWESETHQRKKWCGRISRQRGERVAEKADWSKGGETKDTREEDGEVGRQLCQLWL